MYTHIHLKKEEGIVSIRFVSEKEGTTERVSLEEEMRSHDLSPAICFVQTKHVDILIASKIAMPIASQLDGITAIVLDERVYDIVQETEEVWFLLHHTPVSN